MKEGKAISVEGEADIGCEGIKPNKKDNAHAQ